jgi:hypothetical protein
MLHGDININGHLIGTWKAVNINPDPQVEGEDQTYRVLVEYTNKAGYHLVADFEVTHPYHAHGGALTLAGKILTEAPNHIRRPLMSEEGYTTEHFARLLR